MKYYQKATIALLAGALAGGAQAQSPIIGKWCNTIENGTRTLTIKTVDGANVAAHYSWSGPGPFGEDIAATYSGGQFKGGNTVYLVLTFKDDTLFGTARRQAELPVTFKRCQ